MQLLSSFVFQVQPCISFCENQESTLHRFDLLAQNCLELRLNLNFYLPDFEVCLLFRHLKEAYDHILFS